MDIPRRRRRLKVIADFSSIAANYFLCVNFPVFFHALVPILDIAVEITFHPTFLHVFDFMVPVRLSVISAMRPTS